MQPPREQQRRYHPVPDVDGSAPARQLLTFAAGGRLYGCDIGAVREIIPSRRCTRLPGAPPYVRGLTNLRGTIVTVIDLSARLGGAGHGPAPAGGGGSIILAEYGGTVVGLAVDGVREVQTVAASDMDSLGAAGAAAPSGTAAGAAGVVAGLGQLGGEVVIILDVQTILTQVLA
jgi:purine-binding chemotaxis protein CheW